MSNELNEKPKIRKRPNVLPICLAAFFNDMGSDMLFAFYPLFYVFVLPESGMTQFGIITSAAVLIGLFARPLTGFISDLKGRRHFIWVGYLLLIISRIFQGLSRIWWQLIPPQGVYELGRGMRNPPREALLAESVPQNERGRVYALLESMDTAGAIIGPLLGLALFYLFLWRGISEEFTYRLIFFIAALPTIVSVFIIAAKTREVRSFDEKPERQAADSSEKSKVKEILMEHKVLLLFTVISCLFALWAVTENFMLVCATKILGFSRANRAQIIPVVILYWFINVTYAPSALYSGSLSDKIGRKTPVLISFVILAALTLGFAFVTKYWQIAILFACHGLYQGFLKPSQKALVADLAPTEIRGTIMGTYSWATGISAIPATAIFGLLWDLSGGWKLPFLLSGAFIALCALLLGLFVHEPKWGEEAKG